MASKVHQHERYVQPNKDGRYSPVPAYFKSLTIENIRSFGPVQTLDLSNKDGRPAQWTIILGDNGFGKTTLLQCLADLQPTYRLSIKADDNVLRHLAEPKCITKHNRSYTQQLARKMPCRMSCEIFYGSKIKSNADYEIFGSFGVRYGDIKPNANNFIFRSGEIDKGETIHGLVCYGYGATRRMGRGQLSAKQADSDTTASLFNEDAELINAEEWYLQADYSQMRSPSEHLERQRDQVRDILIRLLPDVDDLRISEPQKTSPDNYYVEVKTPFGWVALQSLSLGYRTLIAWVVDFAHRMFERYPNSKAPLSQPAVVLVDEIDLHLHPRFQRVLMNYLTELFPNTQFIATAHSPLVVQAAENANIVLLRREGDHTVIDNDIDVIKNWRIDQVLTSDLFGLESARPPKLDPLLEERTRILGKARLTKADRGRLEFLESQIGDLPIGETPDDMEALDIVRRAAMQLKLEQVPVK